MPGLDVNICSIAIIQVVLSILNVFILLLQMVLRSEVKRLDEKINIFSSRLSSLEKCVWKMKDDTRSH
jgi:cell division protein FtsL